MADLFWPGDERAGDLLTDAAFLAAMVDVEAGWLAALVGSGVAPESAAAADLHALVTPDLTGRLARDAEGGGNPAMVLVAALRDGSRETAPDAAAWLHRGLTSQDVRRHRADALRPRRRRRRSSPTLREQVDLLARLVEEHRDTPMVARTLTQHAVPTTFGLKAAGWLTGVLDAYDDVAALVLPVQVGGAAGTLAATVELAAGLPDPVEVAHQLSVELAERLGLAPSHAVAHVARHRHPARRRAGRAAPTRGAGSPTTSSPSAGPRSASSPRAPAAGRRRCRTRPTRSSPCWCDAPR